MCQMQSKYRDFNIKKDKKILNEMGCIRRPSKGVLIDMRRVPS